MLAKKNIKQKNLKNKNLITKKNRCFSSWPSILGRDGPMSNAYRLAIQYINESRPITATEVNKVLAFSGISISQDMLNKILSRPRLDFSDLDSSTIKTEKFLQSIGTFFSTNSKINLTRRAPHIICPWRRGLHTLSGPLIPVKVYEDVEKQKREILSDNNGKPGIYCFTNKINGKRYVGSGVDLKKRIKNYYSLNLMQTKIKLGQSAIYSAILKYGHSNFKLEILEYCERYVVIDREGHYFNLLKPEYNLLPIAGSWLGYKHSSESKNKTRASLIGRNKGELNPMFGVVGENHPRFGKTTSEETKLKMSKSSGTAIKVVDLETGVITNYVSMTKASEALDVSTAALSKRFKDSSFFILRGKYQIEKN